MKSLYTKWNLIVVGLFVISWGVSRYFFQCVLIQGSSMEPTYHNGDLVILNKYSHDYDQNDVIVFYCENLSDILVKRIVAVPGDTVYITARHLFVNDKLCSFYSDYLFDYDGMLSETVYLKDNEYLVIGDNIENSIDSRYDVVGVVVNSSIIGKIN